ncbi:MAG: sodium/proline symporter [Gomphosphaeria aponina SAG 52.96 = DSM 107014]|uniref:Sodium/proline symporter n=1 Tax=Gomphosphaeria aponina SAG 52.96 = DSM 107014 TaxID=1521640 RepID=A0A941GNI4_9CHRO|nr:sodium/proline symporter [Gomphosphaeria aponina SAG 52.96 = DSM 107014]
MVIAVTLIALLLSFIVVGIVSETQKQNTTTDYLLASRNVNPWLTALSAMATGQSGLLFIGQVGFAYTRGVSSIWLTIGWAFGDYLAWCLIFKRLRELSAANAIDTVSSFLGHNVRGSRWIVFVSAIITIAFLGSYAAAQLVAGSKALYAVFGWNYYLGIILGAVIVGIYCFSGGIRASIWTDAVQAIIMIGSLLLLLGVTVVEGGGVGEVWRSLGEIDPALINFNPPNLQLGLLPFIFGWVVAGFGVVGQPHILVRAMAIDSANNMGLARDIKVVCGLITSFSAIGVGLTGRILLPAMLAGGDPELTLPYLALEFLPDILIGLMLAGLFSATMSTADSCILSCSAALTQDLFPGAAHSYKLVQFGTLTVTVIVLAIALTGDDSVFTLVTFSWSALASGLGPLLVVRVLEKPITTPVALTMMLTGIFAALSWNLVLHLSSIVYEVLPAMAAGTLVYFLLPKKQA